MALYRETRSGIKSDFDISSSYIIWFGGTDTKTDSARAFGLLDGLGWQCIYLDGGEAARSFLECGLVKQLTLTRIPIILGTGKPLFRNTLPEIIVKHLHTRSFASGLVQSDYEVV